MRNCTVMLYCGESFQTGGVILVCSSNPIQFRRLSADKRPKRSLFPGMRILLAIRVRISGPEASIPCYNVKIQKTCERDMEKKG